MSCRHCGKDIIERNGDWVHAHKLYRCQEPDRPYGYEARPDDGAPCTCWACERFGPTSS